MIEKRIMFRLKDYTTSKFSFKEEFFFTQNFSLTGVLLPKKPLAIKDLVPRLRNGKRKMNYLKITLMIVKIVFMSVPSGAIHSPQFFLKATLHHQSVFHKSFSQSQFLLE
jgi:hypothetical protein